jgi:hypothetical protein
MHVVCERLEAVHSRLHRVYGAPSACQIQCGRFAQKQEPRTSHEVSSAMTAASFASASAHCADYLALRTVVFKFGRPPNGQVERALYWHASLSLSLAAAEVALRSADKHNASSLT